LRWKKWLETPEDHFVPERSAEGAWYPVDGGMIAGMKSACAVNDCLAHAFSGIGAIKKALDGIEEMKPDSGLFLELLALRRRLVNGPKVQRTRCDGDETPPSLAFGGRTGRCFSAPGDFGNHGRFFRHAGGGRCVIPIRKSARPCATWEKFSADDELNCGGCGYDSCREFGIALLGQKSRTRDVRDLYAPARAQRRPMRSSRKCRRRWVIVNDAMRVIEFNAAFVNLFAPEKVAGGDSAVSIEGIALAEVMPFASLFHNVLKSGEDILDRDLRFQTRFLHATIFSI